MSGILSGVRGDLGKVCMKELNMYNSPSIMARCGSKGKSTCEDDIQCLTWVDV